MLKTLLKAALVISFSSSMVFAANQNDWFSSLYTGEGVELRNDERVFTLFAVFNALGFDAGPVSRKEPVPKVQYHAVRQQVRAKVIGGDVEVRKAAEIFLDAHPTALKKYLTYALQSDSAPFAAGAKAKDLQDLKGLEAILAKAWTGWKLEEVLGQVQNEYRASLKSYLISLDAPLLKARALFKTPETTEVLLAVNLLDAHDSVRGSMGEKGEFIIVVGPSEKPNIEGVIREFARLQVESAVNKNASKWGGGAAVLREAQLLGATETNVNEYASTLLATAATLKAMDANEAAYDAASNKGYFGMKDVAKLFDEGKTPDAMILDALQKVETRRPAKK